MDSSILQTENDLSQLIYSKIVNISLLFRLLICYEISLYLF